MVNCIKIAEKAITQKHAQKNTNTKYDVFSRSNHAARLVKKSVQKFHY
jgi:hypothetical protein